MIIHTVAKGETLSSIARMYNTSPLLLSQNNEIDETMLVEGQTIVVLIPKTTHTVSTGETLYSIAEKYGVSVVSLLQNNPVILQNGIIYPGQTIVIEYEGEKRGVLAVNGYAYPYIDKNILIQTLPYLSFITIFTYGFTPNGELIGTNDDEIIRIALDYGVAPIMLISTLTTNGTFSNELANQILNNSEASQNLIENILDNMRKKGYKALDVDFEYIYPEDREKYVEFIGKLSERLNNEGYFVMTALAPKTSSNQAGLLYEAHDYKALGEVSNAVLLMTYEWGYTYGPPQAVAPLPKVREVVEYAITQISPEKIFMGIPNYGYDWTLPYVKGSKAKSLGNVEAVTLARKVGSTIYFDENAQAPFFNYTDPNTGKEHIVWFEDAKSIEAKLNLISEFSLVGTGIWNIMRPFPQAYLVINSLFNIYKAL